MIVRIELDMSSEDDREDHKHIMKASDYYCVLWDVAHDILRMRRKYGEYDDATMKVIEEIESDFWDKIRERGIQLD